ncbi:MAG: hypothetical protein K2F64_01240, partial [Muribaculaceae bacterium]|nr:hypothetical protein [Muribaculaceae bacterium]
SGLSALADDPTPAAANYRDSIRLLKKNLKDLHNQKQDLQKSLEEARQKWKIREDILRRNKTELSSRLATLRSETARLQADIEGNSELNRQYAEHIRGEYIEELRVKIENAKKSISGLWADVDLSGLKTLREEVGENNLPSDIVSFRATLDQAIKDKEMMLKIEKILTMPYNEDDAQWAFKNLDKRMDKWPKIQSDEAMTLGQSVFAYKKGWQEFYAFTLKVKKGKGNNRTAAGESIPEKGSAEYRKAADDIAALFSEFYETEYYKERYSKLPYLSGLIASYEKAAKADPFSSESEAEKAIVDELKARMPKTK